jgi:hypothetical protein
MAPTAMGRQVVEVEEAFSSQQAPSLAKASYEQMAAKVRIVTPYYALASQNRFRLHYCFEHVEILFLSSVTLPPV